MVWDAGDILPVNGVPKDTVVKFGSNSDNLPSSNDPVSVCAKNLCKNMV